ncbi:MAG TPA: hypothetical protein VFF16_18305 [Telluria sp.]|nr:hypothetical protein [Telluria sp.]
MTKLNKKIALFLFAIGVGAALPAFADQCYYTCSQQANHCLASGGDPDTCDAQKEQCLTDCYSWLH